VYRLVADDDAWTVERVGAHFRVRGKRGERVVAMTDLANPDAVALLQRTLGKLGVLEASSEPG